MASAATPSAAVPVTLERRGGVLVVKIDNPPVNALSVGVRRGLSSAIAVADSDATIAAVLILGSGRNFIAGADIREFGQPPQSPILPEVCNQIEWCSKPVIAAIHGAALGGGLEIALAAHYRQALAGARIGLPEVTLGLMPGAGGTQRAPRLIGVAPALELMLGGQPVDADRALALGLVDRLGRSDDVLMEGLTYTLELLSEGAAPRRTRDASAAIADPAAGGIAINAARAELATKYRGLFSPSRIIDAVEVGLSAPFDEAIKRERELFHECLDSPQRHSLVYAFFAEREAAKVPELEHAHPRRIDRVGVIGGGTMGVGITVTLLDAGLTVTMVERDEERLALGRANVARIYDGLVAKNRLDAAARDLVLTRFSGSTTYDVLADADLVVEAVFEDMQVKKEVFATLDRVCKPGAVLATNTSYLDIEELATGVSRAQDVIGLHFFSPAHIMKLLEIVVPGNTAPDVVCTGFSLARRLKKVPVRAGVCDGFIGNRILAAYRQAADYMLEAGASPYQIDRAVRNFGFPMGPFAAMDLAGGDIGWAARKRRAATRDPRARYVAVADRLCERGWFGQKTGRGWYLYPNGARAGQEDPEVLAIVEEERRRTQVNARSFSDDEILRRYLAAMINEGANVVSEGIARRPLDVDVTMLYGYGFPRYRGGPLYHADRVGLPTTLADIREFALEDAIFWKPSVLLVSLVERGADIASLNQPGKRSQDP